MTPTGKIKFDSNLRSKPAREKLIELFPKDEVLLSVCEPLNMKTAMQQIYKLLIYADGDTIYPNYNFLGTATGRFRATKPELHNLAAVG